MCGLGTPSLSHGQAGRHCEVKNSESGTPAQPPLQTQCALGAAARQIVLDCAQTRTQSQAYGTGGTGQAYGATS